MKTFIMVASAVVLFSTAASANSFTIECRDHIERGTLKLTNPPVMNCADFELVKKYIGSGVSVGPDSKINELVSAIEKIQPAPKSQPVEKVEVEPLRDHFNGIRRHDEWFNPEPIRTSTNSSKCADGWLKIKLEDGGVSIRRNEFSQ